MRGHYGLEHIYSEPLSGNIGIQLRQRIAPGFSTLVHRGDSINAEDGMDVVTTLDVELQHIADAALRKQMVAQQAIWGTTIVMDVETGDLVVAAKDGRVLDLVFGEDGMIGEFGQYEISAARNFFSSKDKTESKAADEILAPWLGTFNMITDGGTLSVTLAKKGKVTIKGTIDGEKVSAKSQLLIGEEWMCIPVVYSKKAVNLAFTIWLSIDDGEAEVIGLNAILGTAGTLKTGAKFYIDDAIFSDISGIVTYNGKAALPNGESVSQSKTKWVVANGAKAAKVAYKKGVLSITEGKKGAGVSNISGLKLSYKS
jgi:hypothetical protein